MSTSYDRRLCLSQDIVVGAACADLRHQLDVSYPVTNGIVQNWDDMGHIWDNAFYSELKVCLTLLVMPYAFSGKYFPLISLIIFPKFPSSS
jgi:actin-related protein